MANKIVAVFLICVVLSAFANVEARIVSEQQKFKSCFENCEKDCAHVQGEYTHCEMKCDSECSAKEFADKLQIKI